MEVHRDHSNPPQEDPEDQRAHKILVALSSLLLAVRAVHKIQIVLLVDQAVLRIPQVLPEVRRVLKYQVAHKDQEGLKDQVAQEGLKDQVVHRIPQVTLLVQLVQAAQIAPLHLAVPVDHPAVMAEYSVSSSPGCVMVLLQRRSLLKTHHLVE